MGDRFDKLAKDAAADLPRRELFRLVGGGLLGILLASVGLSADKNNCGRLCAICCQNLDLPPRSEEFARCIRDCHNGEGPCGPIVCPKDDPTVSGASADQSSAG
jgi:hypothetical protein